MADRPFPRRGGVGRGLGSDGRKGGRKSARKKQPGPKPKGPPKKKKLSKKAQKRAQMEEVRKRKRELDTQQRVEELAPTVTNSRGRSRGYRENCVFLVLFCNLYTAAVAGLADE
jgi:hypothetical protein